MKIKLKYIVLMLVLLLSTSTTWSQKIDFQKPPQHENTYLFKVLKYNRQPKPPKYMQTRINEVSKKPVQQWNAQDSLFYAYENVHLENFDLALSIFAKLEVDTIQEKHAQTLYRATLQQLKRYKLLKAYNEETLLETPSSIYSVKNAIDDLTDAYIKYNQNDFDNDSTHIFPILFSDSLEEMNPDRSPNKNRLVSIAFAVDSAFRHFSVLHKKTDFLLSQAFEEMGDFQLKYFYLTNAEFYYTVSRFYYANDSELIVKYNNVVNEMNDKNYISLSVKRLFGKIIKNRYRMSADLVNEVQKDTIIKNQDTPPPPKPRKGSKDYLPWIDNSILIMIILGLALIFVVFFMKVKK